MESKLDLILSEIKNLTQRINDIEGNMGTNQDLEKVATKVEDI